MLLWCSCHPSKVNDETISESLSLAELIAEWQADPTIPGVLLHVENDSGVLFSDAVGKRSFSSDIDAAVSDHFRTASVGKIFTAITVLRMAEEGLLALDDTIDNYLAPGLVNRLHVQGSQNRGASITIEQLLSHTSGLPNTDSDIDFQGWVFEEPGRVRAPEELLEFSMAQDALFAPGAGQSYSSPGYWLLGLIIESAAGRPYHVMVRDLVMDPLGLENTYEEANELPDGIKVNASYYGDIDLSGLHPSFEYADGGFVTTASDLASLGLALAKGRPFSQSTTYENMIRTRGDQGVGLGVFVDTSPKGEIVLSHTGFWGIGLFVYPERPLVISFAINQVEPAQWGAMISRIARAAIALDDER